MKKNKILILIVVILLLILGITILLHNIQIKKTKEYEDLKKYISIIYGKTFLIPDFDDINDAEESWLWDNINQYLWANDSIYKEKNSQAYGYTYEEINDIAKILYGDSLKKNFPEGSVAMRYFSYNNHYGPTSYDLESFYNYQIDKIEKKDNIYTVSIYDYIISSYRMLGENPDNLFDIYNNYDFLINGNNATPIISIPELNDKNLSNLMNYKEKLSYKILTIEYDKQTNLYHIKSCKYQDNKPEETLAIYYKKMQDTFEIWNINYDYDDVYTQEEMLVKNFNELSSIYTENSINTYKEEMDLFKYKENGDVYITAGDINITDYIAKIEFKDIHQTNNKISCTVVRTFRESFDPSDEEYNNTYTKSDDFIIRKQSDGSWLIDKFNYNNYIEK